MSSHTMIAGAKTVQWDSDLSCWGLTIDNRWLMTPRSIISLA